MTKRITHDQAMNETRWTPGPWRVCYDGTVESGSAQNTPADYREVCMMPTRTHKEMIDSGDIHNARLIAVAPRLYEVLEKAKRVILQGEVPYQDEVILEIDAALAKARGET